MLIARRFLIVMPVAVMLIVVFGTACGDHIGPASPGRSSESSTTASPSVRAAATTTPSSPGVPPLSVEAQGAGFVDVRTVVPGALIDLRYATPNNFTHMPLYPADARCLVHESMAPGLTAAEEALRSQGETLVFWDCYRPHDVQIKMWNTIPDPNWIARPGPYARSHEIGRSVDVTMASQQAQCPPERQEGGLCLVDMGTDFDDFTPRALAFATQGVSADAQANRARLRAAMGAGGLTVYSGEWWHFDGPGAYVERPILDVPVN
jgi:zinc D-Ala-D-Ala dipeptidase